MDEVQQVGFGGIPLGFPLGDGVPDDLRLMGGLVRRLTAVLVILGQGGELLRSLDAIAVQNFLRLFFCGFPAKERPKRHGNQQDIKASAQSDEEGSHLGDSQKYQRGKP